MRGKRGSGGKGAKKEQCADPSDVASQLAAMQLQLATERAAREQAEQKAQRIEGEVFGPSAPAVSTPD
eukprot:gene5257-65528_t